MLLLLFFVVEVEDLILLQIHKFNAFESNSIWKFVSIMLSITQIILLTSETKGWHLFANSIFIFNALHKQQVKYVQRKVVKMCPRQNVFFCPVGSFTKPKHVLRFLHKECYNVKVRETGFVTHPYPRFNLLLMFP